jgi:hypothetical protein
MGASIPFMKFPARIGRFQENRIIIPQDERHDPNIIVDPDDEDILPGPAWIFQNVEITAGEDFLGDILERYSPDRPQESIFGYAPIDHGKKISQMIDNDNKAMALRFFILTGRGK